MRATLLACEFPVVQFNLCIADKIGFSIIPHFIFVTFGLLTFSVKGHVFLKETLEFEGR